MKSFTETAETPETWSRVPFPFSRPFTRKTHTAWGNGRASTRRHLRFCRIASGRSEHFGTNDAPLTSSRPRGHRAQSLRYARLPMNKEHGLCTPSGCRPRCHPFRNCRSRARDSRSSRSTRSQNHCRPRGCSPRPRRQRSGMARRQRVFGTSPGVHRRWARLSRHRHYHNSTASIAPVSPPSFGQPISPISAGIAAGSGVVHSQQQHNWSRRKDGRQFAARSPTNLWPVIHSLDRFVTRRFAASGVGWECIFQRKGCPAKMPE